MSVDLRPSPATYTIAIRLAIHDKLCNVLVRIEELEIDSDMNTGSAVHLPATLGLHDPPPEDEQLVDGNQNFLSMQNIIKF